MKTTQRKRHIVNDNNGNIVLVKITKANVHDTKIDYKLIDSVMNNHDFIKTIYADKGYRGISFNYIENVLNRITLIGNEVKKCCRWVIERRFSWFNGYRRLAKDFEYSISSSKSFIMKKVSRASPYVGSLPDARVKSKILLAHSMMLMKRLG